MPKLDDLDYWHGLRLFDAQPPKTAMIHGGPIFLRTTLVEI